jgi:hypothetical protein
LFFLKLRILMSAMTKANDAVTSSHCPSVVDKKEIKKQPRKAAGLNSVRLCYFKSTSPHTYQGRWSISSLSACKSSVSLLKHGRVLQFGTCDVSSLNRSRLLCSQSCLGTIKHATSKTMIPATSSHLFMSLAAPSRFWPTTPNRHLFYHCKYVPESPLHRWKC